jgi:hypothetical protein
MTTNIEDLDDFTLEIVCHDLVRQKDVRSLSYLIRTSKRFHRVCQNQLNQLRDINPKSYKFSFNYKSGPHQMWDILDPIDWTTIQSPKPDDVIFWGGGRFVIDVDSFETPEGGFETLVDETIAHIEFQGEVTLRQVTDAIHLFYTQLKRQNPMAGPWIDQIDPESLDKITDRHYRLKYGYAIQRMEDD